MITLPLLLPLLFPFYSSPFTHLLTHPLYSSSYPSSPYSSSCSASSFSSSSPSSYSHSYSSFHSSSCSSFSPCSPSYSSLCSSPLLFLPSPTFWVFKLSLCCFESEVVWPPTCYYLLPLKSLIMPWFVSLFLDVPAIICIIAKNPQDLDRALRIL